MNTFKFMPEGWDNEITSLNKENVNEYIQNGEVLQGLVKECDSGYNLHVKLDNGLEGIIPRNEIEAVNIEENGLPRENLCTGKVHKFVQFKVKEVQDDKVVLSRKEVQEDALDWIKNDLQEGTKVEGIVKNIKPYGAFIEIGGGVVGLAHIEDLSVARIKTPSERLKIGQKVNIICCLVFNKEI